MPFRIQLLTYAYVDGIVERREPHRVAHLALIAEHRAAGRLLLAGAVGEPPERGLLAFAGEGDAERFVAADPYVAAGLVREWRVEPWTLVAGLDADQPPA